MDGPEASLAAAGPILLQMPDIAWLPWSVDSFGRARAERKPVLLSIVAGWSQACREMDQSSYADPEVVSIVDQRFVGVGGAPPPPAEHSQR
jgi:uncharacterized protein YyaL (SSP411 family)